MFAVNKTVTRGSSAADYKGPPIIDRNGKNVPSNSAGPAKSENKYVGNTRDHNEKVSRSEATAEVQLKAQTYVEETDKKSSD